MSENTLVSKKPKQKHSAEHKNQTIFLCCMLVLPILNWLVFWLYVNASSIALAFQDARTGVFTFDNFILFWESLTAKNGEIGIATIKHTRLNIAKQTDEKLVPLSTATS